MLGIRLSEEDEQRLARHARDRGRPKSVIARDWIRERLDHESVDEQLRQAARVAARTDRAEDWIDSDFDD